MRQNEQDAGTIAALMKRYLTYRLPRMKRLLARVKDGGQLSDEDIAFLERVRKDSVDNQRLLKRNPEYQELANQSLALFEEIIRRGVENEEGEGRA